MNALTLLKQDHANVEELFLRFETADAADGAGVSRIRDKIVEHLAKHSAIEEQVLYPAIREKLGDERAGIVLESLEEHHIVKWTLSELEKMSASAERFRPKMTVLIESVRHHVEEEENELFERAREAFTMEELNELGDRMEQLKQVAPTRPHPRTPDEPPLNVLVALPVAIIDRTIATAKDLVGSLRNGGRK